MHNGELEHKEARNHSNDDGMLAERLPNEPRPESEGGLAWQARSASEGLLSGATTASLERVHVLELGPSSQNYQHLDEAVSRRSLGRYRRGAAAFHVFGRVIDRPGFAINCLPLFPTHPRVSGADMLNVILLRSGSIATYFFHRI